MFYLDAPPCSSLPIVGPGLRRERGQGIGGIGKRIGGRGASRRTAGCWELRYAPTKGLPLPRV